MPRCLHCSLPAYRWTENLPPEYTLPVLSAAKQKIKLPLHGSAHIHKEDVRLLNTLSHSFLYTALGRRIRTDRVRLTVCRRLGILTLSRP